MSWAAEGELLPTELLVPALAERLGPELKCEIIVDGTRAKVSLHQSGRELVGSVGPIEVRASISRSSYRSGRLVMSIHNTGREQVSAEFATLLEMSFTFDPARDLVRTRHLRGSWHYDACYPPRAFVIEEHLHASADHSKRVSIGGINAGVFSPAIQLAIGANRLHALQIGLEWSGSWEISAGWAQSTFRGEPTPSFTLACQMGLGVITIGPGCAEPLPTIHLCSTDAHSWSAIDDRWRSYLHNEVAARAVGSTRFPVSYDHWFGINERFDLPLLLKQAERASALGCEYFCLDAAWYESDSFEDGLGNWARPDPRRFPNGFDDIRSLGARVNELGMMFGLWQCIQLGRPGTELPGRAPELYRPPAASSAAEDVIARYGTGDSHLPKRTIDGFRLALERHEGVELAVDTLGALIRELSLRWMRFETVPEDGLSYNQGIYRVFERLREVEPELYIEACSGGGQSLDLGMVARANGAWLSDHTTVPSVTRFCQTGALRWFPPEYLNMAITSRDGGPHPRAHTGSALSRMVGTLSFNGDVAAWSDEEAALMRHCVDHYKQIRDRRGLRVRFPLGQPRSVEDWDAVAYIDAEGGDLLYVFRDLGPKTLDLGTCGSDDFSPDGDWRILLADEGSDIHRSGSGCVVELPRWSGALLRRQR